MGIAFSCPVADALGEAFEAVFVRPINGASGKSPFRSFSFNGRDSKPATILKAFGSGKLLIERSLSFNSRERRDPFFLHPETKVSAPMPAAATSSQQQEGKKASGHAGFKRSRFGPQADASPDRAPGNDAEHEAAVKLQKVYKSFRTRRQLADCAVLVEQRWWKLLDFALLKQSSISFFDIKKTESALTRWSRARTKAAKVGKGLSKDKKARKLELQHWLEAIDPRHRYGHNLHFYYDRWLHCESKQPFFYWLDLGEGKEVNLEEKCSRSKLQQQCIKYLGPKEREAYEVIVEDGKLLYKKSRELLDTSQDPKDSKFIFVLSTSRVMYVGQKKKGTFQHSSFLAGGATSAAGRLVVEKGIIKAVWPHSGHYRPTEQNFQEFMSFLKENNVDLSEIKKNPDEDDAEPDRSTGLASNGSLPDLTRKMVHKEDGFSVPKSGSLVGTVCAEPNRGATLNKPSSESKCFGSHNAASGSSKEKKCHRKHEEDVATGLDESRETLRSGKRLKGPKLSICVDFNMEEDKEDRGDDGHYMFCKENLFVEEEEKDGEVSIPPEWILRRMSSRKGVHSCQLGKKLSCKWTTGAGPRIGCVRDYPSELQFRALEQVNLSPRSVAFSTSGLPRDAASPAATKLADTPSRMKGAGTTTLAK